MQTKSALESLILKQENKLNWWKCTTLGVMPATLVVFTGHLWSDTIKPRKPIVVKDMQAQTVYIGLRGYRALVTGEKVLDCRFIPNSAVGWAYAGIYRETAFAFAADKSPNSSRPVQRQSFGEWMWAIDTNDTQVKTTVQHDCDGQLVTTTIGPFSIR